MDSIEKRSFQTLVRNVGSRRHFNRVEFRGIEPNALEDELGELESLYVSHLREVIEAKSFPTDGHFNYIMNFIANLSVRNPRLRGVLTRFHQDIVESIMSLSLSSERVWQRQIDEMRREGIPIRDDVTYEDIKKFHQKKSYEILIDQTYLIQQEFRMLEPVLDCCARRSWCFVSAPEGWQYITSDDPVVLTWTKEDNGPWPPGHGLTGTMVMLSLCSELALIGLFEDIPSHANHRPHQVVAFNTNVARYSNQQIYAKNGDFVVDLHDRKAVRGVDLAQSLRR